MKTKDLLLIGGAGLLAYVFFLKPKTQNAETPSITTPNLPSPIPFFPDIIPSYTIPSFTIPDWSQYIPDWSKLIPTFSPNPTVTPTPAPTPVITTTPAPTPVVTTYQTPTVAGVASGSLWDNIVKGTTGNTQIYSSSSTPTGAIYSGVNQNSSLAPKNNQNSANSAGSQQVKNTANAVNIPSTSLWAQKTGGLFK